MLRVVLVVAVAAVLSWGGATVLQVPVENEGEEATSRFSTADDSFERRGCPLVAAQVRSCRSLYGKEDAWYLNEQRRCSLDERTYIVEPFEQACEAIWTYVEKVAKCTVFSPSFYVVDAMWVGCTLEEPDADGNPLFVLSDEVAVAMVNQMRDSSKGCKHEHGPPLLVDDVRGQLLNRAKGDGCDDILEADKEGTSRRLMLLASAERDPDWWTCSEADSCSSFKTFKYKRTNGDYCRVCCAKTCLYGPPEFRRVCCMFSRERSTCSCTRNNAPSACGC